MEAENKSSNKQIKNQSDTITARAKAPREKFYDLQRLESIVKIEIETMVY